MINRENDQTWMKRALVEARKSADIGEVPVGAVLIDDTSRVFASGNRPITANDPTAHAEIRAIREAAAHHRNYRLVGTTLYVTLEPCVMCMGAIIHSRISRLVFGAYDQKTGAVVSQYEIGSDGKLNHHLQVTGGVLEAECGDLLRSFFRNRRTP